MNTNSQGKEVRRRVKATTSNKSQNGKTTKSQSRKKRNGATFCAFSCITSLIISVLVFLYVVLPATFYFSPTMRRYAVFLNFVSWPPSMNLSDVESFGFDCARNFYIQSEIGVELGVWHVIPESRRAAVCKSDLKVAPLSEDLFKDERPVILYVHGNSGTRGGGHRVDLYKILSGPKVDAHLITFDYRGYGDSTWVAPTVDGVVRDTQVIYEWLQKDAKVNPKRITIWGHSLGTGVTVQLLDSHKDIQPSRVVLETPFTTLSEVAYHHPLTILHRHLPYFEYSFIKPAEHRDTYFNTETRIQRLQFPLLVLHAEDDGVVPYEHGVRLYEKAKAYRDANQLKTPIFFEGFSGKLGYGHKYILRDPELPKIINRFLGSIE